MSELDEFIEHYGVKGMKWGVRKDRKSSSGSKKKTTYQKAPSRLSDQQLKDRVARLELEKKYNELNAPYKTQGQRYASGLLENAGRTAVSAAVGGVVTYVVGRELRRRLG